MTTEQTVLQAYYEGWHSYQTALVQAIAPLSAEQLELRPAPGLRSVGQAVAHIIGARARWFRYQFEEGGEVFEALGRIDRRGRRTPGAQVLVRGLETTWTGMHEAMARWTPQDWAMTWPGEDDSEPAVVTRPWVLWHLIEHDLHHGGEVSITLGVHGLKGLDL
jgi:uncharacterized damage-inducible protein DinB